MSLMGLMLTDPIKTLTVSGSTNGACLRDYRTPIKRSVWEADGCC